MKRRMGEISAPLLLVLALVTIIVLVFLPVINSAVVSTNVNSAINYLTGQGYMVWAQGTNLETQDIFPIANNTYDIGDATGNWYEDLWLGGNTRIDGTLRVGSDVPETALTDGEAFFSGPLRTAAALASKVMDKGSGLFVGADSSNAIEHVGVGSFDLSGGVFEDYFTANAAVFTQADEDNGSFIITVSTGPNFGWISEIDEFIDTTHVVLDTFGWDADFTNQVFVVATHPLLIAGDGNNISATVSGGGHFEIHGEAQTSEFTFKVEHTAAAADTRAVFIEAMADGYTNTDALHITYDTGNETGESEVVHIIVDESNALGAVVDALKIDTTTAGNATRHAVHVDAGFDSALTVTGGAGSKDDPDYGYESTSGVLVDRVNSGGGGSDAFINASVNVEIFGFDNDYILIGDDDTFSIIEVILETDSDRDVLETYEYSTGNDTWSTLTAEEDLRGFRDPGLVEFSPPGDWAKSDASDGDATTWAYYVRITRTRNGGIPVLPEERTFSIWPTAAISDFEIRGDGTIVPIQMADAGAPNHSLYYSTTQSKLVYKDGAGNVHDLWP